MKVNGVSKTIVFGNPKLDGSFETLINDCRVKTALILVLSSINVDFLSGM